MWGRVTAGRREDRSQLARERKVRTLPIMATTSLGGGAEIALPLGVRASLPSPLLDLAVPRHASAGSPLACEDSWR